MKLKFSLILILLCSSSIGLANCISEFKNYKRKVVFSPLTAPISSSANVLAGGVSSTGSSVLGLTTLNQEFSTAGFLYGAAFVYNGQYVFESTLVNFKLYKGRVFVLKVLKEARRGFGDHLEEFVDDLNDLLPVELEDVVEIINEGNEDEAFCQKDKALYTKEKLFEYALKVL